MSDTAVATREDGWRKQLDNMRPEWAALFPRPEQLERFRRVVATAIGSNPDLLAADRRTLFAAATMAAQDGLLPDGREGALVIYNTKMNDGDREVWVKAVRWMPMVAGVLKKVRQSGELLDVSVQVVYAKDRFQYQLGDDARIVHVPDIEEEDRGELRYVYAIARTKDGGTYREVMTRKQVDQIRAASKSQKGPWKDWYEEMARKSVLRRLAKFLPSGHDIEAMFAREEREEALIAEAVPVLPETRTNSRQARINGDWSTLTAEIDALDHMGECDDWKAKNEGRVRGYPEAWQEQVWEYLDKRREALFSAVSK
jgi:recombination protein RecT